MNLKSCMAFVLTAFMLPLMAGETSHSHMGHNMSRKPVLTEAGNDAFGTIQEALKALQADPGTNWKKVDLEALRQHLIDMDNFTKQVSVIAKRNIDRGVELVVRPDNTKSHQSLTRVLAAHPAMLQQETGWDMKVVTSGRDFRLTVVSPDKNDAARIRGLGYIGIMALGDHHQAHHWAMARGQNPHK